MTRVPVLKEALGPLLGAGIGLSLRGIPGAAIGSIVGYLVQHRLKGLLRPRNAPPHAAFNLPEVYARVSFLVKVLATQALADGPLTRKRREAIRSYFRRDAAMPDIAMPAIDRLIRSVERRPPGGPREAVQGMPDLDLQDRLHTLFAAWRVALAEGDASDAAKTSLEDLAGALSIGDAERREVESWFVYPNDDTRERDLRVLDLESGASRDEIHARYKAAARESHPDRYQHLGEAAAREAAERFKAIQAAYERLRRATDASPAASLCPNCRAFTAVEEVECVRCGAAKHRVEGGVRKMRCPFCSQTNTLLERDACSRARCGNCKAVLIR